VYKEEFPEIGAKFETLRMNTKVLVNSNPP